MGFLEEEVARRRLLDYVEALEAERQKMLVFHRELPFALELVSRALESYRLQLAGEAPARTEDCEEATSSEGPVLKEFMPTTKGGASDEDEEVEEREIEQRDWLRSVQLHDAQVEEDLKPAKVVAVEAKTAAGAFQPFAKPAASPAAPGEEKDARGLRKARRCWSPDLHHRFLQALQQLGGSHVATPKQIRDLMKVEGLTNDEVKSHLQKYRLHTSRKSPPAQPSSGGGNSQAAQPQIVFIGNLWTPPGGPAAPAKRPLTGDNASPFAVLRPQAKKHKLIDGGGGGSSNSESTATTSSSAHTITTTESPRS